MTIQRQVPAAALIARLPSMPAALLTRQETSLRSVQQWCGLVGFPLGTNHISIDPKDVAREAQVEHVRLENVTVSLDLKSARRYSFTMVVSSEGGVT